jgi:hypothetical protein
MWGTVGSNTSIKEHDELPYAAWGQLSALVYHHHHRHLHWCALVYARVCSAQAFPMFLSMQVNVSNWSQDGKECSLVSWGRVGQQACTPYSAVLSGGCARYRVAAAATL